ncbi:MAG: hypothetical protein E4H36_09075 [Spirochaetales bacterium]|nr:MAG: hypothetical protein E4H36_09075 [Spirochaetales bacterium]
MGRNLLTVNRVTQIKMLKALSVGDKIDSLEREARNLLSLCPDDGIGYFIASFRRTHSSDPQRSA